MSDANKINTTGSYEVDILENDIRERYPNVLETLLSDQTTQQNIIWATDNYQDIGKGYEYNSNILASLITGENGKLIMPRVKKDKNQQQARAKDMAEVFTPSSMCNAQNNLIDNAWFGRKNVFNTEIIVSGGTHTWQTNQEKIWFPKGKTWKQYVMDNRLEIACGEAPYITSRYDITIGEFIPIENRIGLLDRKLRVINENVNDWEEWLEFVQTAFKNLYAFEWHGDSLLLAREAMLFSFIENYVHKFGKEPSIKSIQNIAEIISWNVWQMDGLKGVIPNSCVEKTNYKNDLFGDIEIKKEPCVGCSSNNILKHNGIYCVIKDWTKSANDTEKKGKKIRFIDTLTK